MPLSDGNIAADSSDPTAPHQAQTSPQSRNPFVASPSVEATVSQPTATPEAQRKYSIDAAGRRKSATDGTFAAALMHQKRALGDPLQAAKRESFNDQRRDSGWLGGLWNKWVLSHIRRQWLGGEGVKSDLVVRFLGLHSNGYFGDGVLGRPIDDVIESETLPHTSSPRLHAVGNTTAHHHLTHHHESSHVRHYQQ